jgi:hypothetical protein
MYRVAGILLFVSTAVFMIKAPVTEKQEKS